jgi:membrane protease YdiL (CAAX protease family)
MSGKSVGVVNPWLRVPIYAILLFEGAALIARSYLDVQLRNDGMQHFLATDLSYLIVPPLLLVLMYPILKGHGQLLLALFNLRTLNLRLILVGISLGVISYLATVSTNIALSAWEISVRESSLLAAGLTSTWSCESIWFPLLGILVSAILIPVIEEAINRGFLLHYFLPKGKLTAILLSSVLFAVFHQPHAIPPAFVIGIYLALLTLRSGSLFPATIAHCVHNLLVQIDIHCISIVWIPTNSISEIVVSGASAVMAIMVLLVVAGIMVSPKITGA